MFDVLDMFSGSYPHASQFYYVIDRKGGSDGQIEKRHVHKFDRTVTPLVDQGSLTADTSGVRGTKSQSLDFRLNVSVNPMHYQPVLSSAGIEKDKVSSTSIAEIHDKLLNTVETIAKRNSNASLQSLPKCLNEDKAVMMNNLHNNNNDDKLEQGSARIIIPVQIIDDNNQDDDDYEVEEISRVEISSPLHFVERERVAKRKSETIPQRNG